MPEKQTCSFKGFDYGSKMAGTTAMCWQEGSRLQVRQSEKNHDADEFVIKMIRDTNPQRIYLDAPLSLPSVYTNKGDDYFYRECDRELGAMSPMFLGGLTARAIKLRDQLVKSGIEVYEVYPAALVRILSIGEFYKKDLNRFLIALEGLFHLEVAAITNWHQVDAALAWFVGERHRKQQYRSYGRQNEGIILV